MNRIGEYEVKSFTQNRENITLISQEGHRKLSIHSLLELDVTSALERLRHHKTNGVDVSFTAWICKCVAQAVADHPSVNAYRHGWKKILVFEDVDIPTPIEKFINNESQLLTYIIRKVNSKTIQELTKEIRTAQQEHVDVTTQVLGKTLTKGEQWLTTAPLPLKKLVLRLIRKNGLLKKKHMGTIGVSAIGMKGTFPGWVIPQGGPVAMLVVVTGIRKKPGLVNNSIVPRDFLHMTITTDHALIDGGPLARFISRLTELIETAYEL